MSTVSTQTTHASGRRQRAVLGACVVVALVLRLPWIGAHLGLDEGGISSVAQHWFDSSGSLYGSSWLDRPPLLVLLWRGALSLGPLGVRLLGAAAAVLLVLLVARLAAGLGGARAERWGAALTAVLASSAAISSIFTPAELLAAVPTAASVLLVLRGGSRLRWLFAAGALATAACLIKQSSIDAFAAGAVAVAVVPAAGGSVRARIPGIGAWLAGIVAACLPVLAWVLVTDVTMAELVYAVFGFRVDALHALGGGHGSLGSRLPRLWLPAVGSGLFLLLPWTLLGLGSRGMARRDRAILASWLVSGAVAVLAGGSYWPHYLIQLVAPCAVLAAVALASSRARVLTRATLGLVALVAIGGFALGSVVQHEHPYQNNAYVVGSFVKANARHDDTIYVLYAHANVGWYSGLRSPYPYSWSLMLRTIGDADERLADLLESERRPTWLVQWQPLSSYDQTETAEIDEAIERGYRRVATPCGHPVFVRLDVLRPLGTPPEACTSPHSVLP